MIKIPLHISRDDNYCAPFCVFLDTDFLNTTGTCMLFNKTLRADRKWETVEKWITCGSCDNALEKFEESKQN